jgi:hypothetical protein
MANVNLLSIPTLMKKGVSYHFGGGTCVLRKGNMIVGEVKSSNFIYSLRCKAMPAAQ